MAGPDKRGRSSVPEIVIDLRDGWRGGVGACRRGRQEQWRDAEAGAGSLALTYSEIRDADDTGALCKRCGVKLRREPRRQAFQRLPDAVEIARRQADAAADDDAGGVERELDVAAQKGRLARRGLDDLLRPALAGGRGFKNLARGGAWMVRGGLGGDPVARDVVLERAGSLVEAAELAEMTSQPTEQAGH